MIKRCASYVPILWLVATGGAGCALMADTTVEKSVQPRSVRFALGEGCTTQDPWCASAVSGPSAAVQCQSDTDCSLPQRCSRSWNAELEWLWSGSEPISPSFGHCIDPTGTIAADLGVQADICCVRPLSHSMGVPYRLPPGGRLRISDSEPLNKDGIGVVLDRRLILHGNGATLLLDRPSGAAEFRGIASKYSTQVLDALPEFSSIRDLSIKPYPGGPSGDATGISLDVGAVRVENVEVSDLSTGIACQGRTRNAYGIDIANPVTRNATKQALFLDGNDGALVRGLDVRGGAGVQESSLVGNTDLGAFITTDASALRSLTIDTGRQNVVVGLVLRGGPDPQTSGSSNVWAGGNAINRIVPLPGPAAEIPQRIGSQRTYLTFQIPTEPYQVGIPYVAGAAMVLTSLEDIDPIIQDEVSWFLKREADAAAGEFWGIYSANPTQVRYYMSPLRWLDHSVSASHGKPRQFRLGNRAAPEGQGPAGAEPCMCCDSVDNDLDGLIDLADPTCTGQSCTGCNP